MPKNIVVLAAVLTDIIPDFPDEVVQRKYNLLE